MRTATEPLDPDFSRQVLEELYAYRRKRRSVAWLLWATLGFMGAHRFYLERPFTGVAQLFTAGGALGWWLFDAFHVNRMVWEHNEEQENRKRSGQPPLEMDFMPPLDLAADLSTPAWVGRWSRRSTARKSLRLAGDLLVLLTAGAGLGAAVFEDGGLEAAMAVVLLALMIVLGAGPG
ncbi:MAG: TM2 domain-containing protein, partial [Gemmatimonadota bacterium]